MPVAEAPPAPQPPETEEAQRLRAHLAHFIMDLIKAMTKAGYYDPDHPEAQRARAGLHARLRALLKGKSELGFVRTASAENPEILVEGVLPEPISLAALLGKGVGALFVPKLFEYFERHALQSFTIRGEIAEAEFEALVDVLAREGGGGAGRVDLDQALRRRDVLHVSVLFSQELLGRDRRLHWRVRLALSRLRKDLKVVRLYREAGPEAVERARQGLVQDVVRAIGRADLVCAVLLNADLVAADPEVLGDRSLEARIVQAIPPLMLPPVLAAATREVAATAQAGAAPGAAGAPERLRRLLVELADRTHAVAGEAGTEALVGLLQARLLAPDDLSPALREVQQVQRLAQGLTAGAEAGLRQLREALARPGAAGTIPLGPLAADLLRRGQYPLASAVLRLALEHPQALVRCREILGRETVIRPLIRAFVSGTRDARDQVAEVLLLAGPAAVEPLLDLLAHTADRAVRRAACATLARMGTDAVGALVDRLERPEQPWYMIRNVLMILGEIGAQPPLDLRPFLRHGHPRVREEAAAAIARLAVPGAEGLLLNALRDTHAPVRARAVAGLGLLRTRNVGALHFIVEAVRRKTAREPEEDDAVQIQACAALQRLGNLPLAGGRRVETVLAEALEGEARRGLLRLFGAGGGRAKSPAVRAAILDALAAVGTAASADALRRIAEDPADPLAPRARDALQRLQPRAA